MQSALSTLVLSQIVQLCKFLMVSFKAGLVQRELNHQMDHFLNPFSPISSVTEPIDSVWKVEASKLVQPGSQFSHVATAQGLLLVQRDISHTLPPHG